MKDNELFRRDLNNSTILLSSNEYQEFKEISKLTREMHSHMFGSASQTGLLQEYISEKDAQKEFGRKTTWFWNQRTNGRLPYKKMGSKVYYLKSDLIKLLNA